MVLTASNRFVVDSFTPAYIDPSMRASMAQRVEAALDELACCCACPRNCKINRLENETKVCHRRWCSVADARDRAKR